MLANVREIGKLEIGKGVIYVLLRNNSVSVVFLPRDGYRKLYEYYTTWIYIIHKYIKHLLNKYIIFLASSLSVVVSSHGYRNLMRTKRTSL